MSLSTLYQELCHYSNMHELNTPLEKADLRRFEDDNGLVLPAPLVELLSFFDGGEIFIPGTIVYGVNSSNRFKSIKEANSSTIRNNYRIPKSYLIFSCLNYGDFICVNLKDPHDVIQWDHEKDEEFCSWGSIEEWLSETIQSYKDYEDGDQ